METATGVLLADGAYLPGSVSPSYLLVRMSTGEDIRRTRTAYLLNFLWGIPRMARDGPWRRLIMLRFVD